MTPRGGGDDSSEQERYNSNSNNNNNNNNNSNNNMPETSNASNVTATTTAAAERKFRLAKAQEEIDRILSSPVDPPFDMESELSKVVSISPQLVMKEGSPEHDLDTADSAMEEELYQAVKQQDYGKAAQVKERISQSHVDDCGAVLQVNSAYYRAFSEKNKKHMEEVWLPDNASVCIHPSAKPLVGVKDVLACFQRMFESSDGSFQRNWMEPNQIRLSVKGATAIVTCEEYVYARRFVRGKKRQTELIHKLQATNIFRKVGSKWFMTYHHSSWHADSEAAKLALKGHAGGGGGAGASSRPKVVFRGKRGGNHGSGDSPSEMDGILGHSFGPLLGSGQESDGIDNDDEKPSKKIFMGSISDILGNQLGDLLGNGATNNKNDDNEESNAIIQFSRMDDDDDDEEDADEDEEDMEDDDDEESVTMIKRWAKSSENNKTSKSMAAGAAKAKDSLRQNCISALRRLADQGNISPKQKRVLFTDIITSTAKGEFSMVEVAYELLYDEGGDVSDFAEEEFADQCRVFAQHFIGLEDSSPK
jgi:hypothetical protein